MTLEDYAVISAAYAVMLEKLHQSVPNLDWEQSVLGGHSNGAHTLSVLLAANDPTVTSRFHNFWFHEGGFILLPACLSGKDRRVLALVADESLSGPSEYRSLILDQMKLIERQAKLMKCDFLSITMQGYGHDVPPEYMTIVRQFARRQPIDDIVQRQRALQSQLEFPLKSHPDTTSWYDLLVGDLTNAKLNGNVWQYQGRSLLSKKKGILWTKAIHADYLLDFEFVLKPGGNGGIVLAGKDSDNISEHCPIVELQDDRPQESKLKPTGQVNRMTVVVRNQAVTVLLNGATIQQNTKPFPAGQIGVIGSTVDGGIEYRNLKLLRLNM